MNKKFKKASTLAEVMIVLGIISTVMVASISIMVNSMIRIRVNDTEDYSNSLMVKALEIAKSPASVAISEDVSTVLIGNSVFFSLEDDNTLLFQAIPSIITSCPENSAYNANSLLPEDIAQTADVCVQVEIIPRFGNNNTRVYEVIVRTIYTLPGGAEKINAIRGFRYDSF